MEEGDSAGAVLSEYSGDPGRRMEAVSIRRQETAGELLFRATGGAAGQPPMERISRERRQVARSLAGGAQQPTRIPQGAGSPLPAKVRSQMEPRLGADLDAVRIHTGGESAEAAKGLGARAFTVGSDVHFNGGEFQPGSDAGDKLLAHELTHVVQGQKSGIQRKAEDDSDLEVSQPDDPAEKEADAVAEKITGEEEPGKPPEEVGAAVSRKVIHRSQDLDEGEKRKQLEQEAEAKVQAICGRLPAADPQIDHKPEDDPARQAYLAVVRAVLSELQQLESGPDWSLVLKKMTKQQTETLMSVYKKDLTGVDQEFVARLRGERLAAVAEGTEDQYFWCQSGPDADNGYKPNQTMNDFAGWMNGGAQPTGIASMNCWEVCLFSAFQAGILSQAFLKSIYDEATAAGVKDQSKVSYRDVLEKRLTAGAALFSPARASRGDLLFIKVPAGDGGDEEAQASASWINHVAMYLGQSGPGQIDIMSLWDYPSKRFAKTTLHEILSGLGVTPELIEKELQELGALEDVKVGPCPG